MGIDKSLWHGVLSLTRLAILEAEARHDDREGHARGIAIYSALAQAAEAIRLRICEDEDE